MLKSCLVQDTNRFRLHIKAVFFYFGIIIVKKKQRDDNFVFIIMSLYWLGGNLHLIGPLYPT